MESFSNLAARNLSSVFNQRNTRIRRAALRSLWAADGVLWTSDGTYIGYKAVDRAIASFLARFPEYDFQVVGEIDEIPDAARMRWALGTPGSTPAMTGLDVIVVAKGKITAMYKFQDGPAF